MTTLPDTNESHSPTIPNTCLIDTSEMNASNKNEDQINVKIFSINDILEVPGLTTDDASGIKVESCLPREVDSSTLRLASNSSRPSTINIGDVHGLSHEVGNFEEAEVGLENKRATSEEKNVSNSSYGNDSSAQPNYRCETDEANTQALTNHLSLVNKNESSTKITEPKSNLAEETSNDISNLRELDLDLHKPLNDSQNKLIKKTDDSMKVANGKPLVLDLPKLEAEVVDINSNSAYLSGFKYKSNLLPSAWSLQPAAPPQQIEGIVIKDSNFVTFGSILETPGDLVLNQYVDLSSTINDPNVNLSNRVTVTDSSRPENCCLRMRYLWAALTMVLLLGGTVTAAALLTLNENKEVEVTDPGAEAPANYTLRLITRGQWSSHLRTDMPELRVKPARFSIISHTAGNTCNVTAICMNRVKSIESWHLQSGFGGIGYNFLIGGDGFIYEGRGWGKEGAHTYGKNCASVGVGFIGDFDKDALPQSMVEAYRLLMEEGLRRGELSPDYKMFGQYQLRATASPGLNIMAVLKSWPHWAGTFTQEDDVCGKK